MSKLNILNNINTYIYNVFLFVLFMASVNWLIIRLFTRVFASNSIPVQTREE